MCHESARGSTHQRQRICRDCRQRVSKVVLSTAFRSSGTLGVVLILKGMPVNRLSFLLPRLPVLRGLASFLIVCSVGGIHVFKAHVDAMLSRILSGRPQLSS